MSVSFCLSAYLSVCLSASSSVCMCLSVSVCLSPFLSQFLSLSLPVLSFSPSLAHFISLFLTLSFSLSPLSFPLFLSFYLPLQLSVLDIGVVEMYTRCCGNCAELIVPRCRFISERYQFLGAASAATGGTKRECGIRRICEDGAFA